MQCGHNRALRHISSVGTVDGDSVRRLSADTLEDVFEDISWISNTGNLVSIVNTQRLQK